MASLKLPGQLFLGAGSVLELERLLKEHARVVLMTDRGVRATGICEAVVAAMERAGCVVSVVDNIPSEPSLPAAQEAIEACPRKPGGRYRCCWRRQRDGCGKARVSSSQGFKL